MDKFINETQSIDIRQQYDDTCAIKSQQIILNDFGVPVNEDQCIRYAIEHGWYNGNGTLPENVGKILIDAGIPCTQRSNANVYDLAKELADGHKVIVGVDSGELWKKDSLWDHIKEWFENKFYGDIADHALIVAGVDLSDPHNPMVIITDPGTGESSAKYPLDQFMDAWADSNCFMVSTDVATPSAKESFVQNGLTEGHIDSVAGVDYDTLQDFQDYSHHIDYINQGPQLYDMFNTFPTMNGIGFNDALVQFNLPPIDFPPVQPIMFDPLQLNYSSLNTPVYVDPFMFNYNNLCNIDWMTGNVGQGIMPMPQLFQPTFQQELIDAVHHNTVTFPFTPNMDLNEMPPIIPPEQNWNAESDNCIDGLPNEYVPE